MQLTALRCLEYLTRHSSGGMVAEGNTMSTRRDWVRWVVRVCTARRCAACDKLGLGSTCQTGPPGDVNTALPASAILCVLHPIPADHALADKGRPIAVPHPSTVGDCWCRHARTVLLMFVIKCWCLVLPARTFRMHCCCSSHTSDSSSNRQAGRIQPLYPVQSLNWQYKQPRYNTGCQGRVRAGPGSG